MSPQYLRELVNYWEKSYERRHHEARLNQFSNFKTTLMASAYISSINAAKGLTRCRSS